ncbi:hypothetical protein M527_07190 [Sphingobium indicum IP26]|uniref:Uncharacterized protein n=1 Tax=Sphingobium indicum F2 TaxID=1450518 RepID=A0A8E0WT01_9SPHN|nr:MULTISPECIES: hypothetical protein [Sphingobium]EPR09901.1 hypothetical protein M527_07190 [Sphingobium indicum IP26]EQB05029.1 hypothetical protein L286_09705 [Sphingobium sp. HDIP04]KER36694.1 hypothetical protein AL00_09485 [Sphingobium indicum F2]
MCHGLHQIIASSHAKLRRGMTWCKTCGRSAHVNAADALRHGWPKCCGATMTIDAPEEREALHG